MVRVQPQFSKRIQFNAIPQRKASHQKEKRSLFLLYFSHSRVPFFRVFVGIVDTNDTNIKPICISIITIMIVIIKHTHFFLCRVRAEMKRDEAPTSNVYIYVICFHSAHFCVCFLQLQRTHQIVCSRFFTTLFLLPFVFTCENNLRAQIIFTRRTHNIHERL